MGTRFWWKFLAKLWDLMTKAFEKEQLSISKKRALE
jgi:hypothetical protein